MPLAHVDLYRLSFNQLLRKLRDARQLRQVDLGAKAYMDASTISRLEGGQHSPTASDVARLAAALRLNESEHDALRAAFERELVRGTASPSGILVHPPAVLGLVQRQLEDVRRVRAGGDATHAIGAADRLTDWIQLLAQSAVAAEYRKTLTDLLAAVLTEQYFSYRDYLQPLAATEEIGSPELPQGMVAVATRLADLGLWQVLELDSTNSRSSTVALHAFHLGLDGIRLRRHGSLQTSFVELTAAVESGHISGAACDLLVLHSAHTMRNLGRFDEAECLYKRLAEHDGPYRKRAAYQLADLAFVRGRFQEAVDAVGMPHEDVHLHGESIRLIGHVYRINGLFDQAEDFYLEALQLARWSGSRAMEGKALANLVQALSWNRPSQAIEWSQEAIAVNEMVGNSIELVKIYAAVGVAAATDHEARITMDRSRDLARQIGYQGGLLFTLVAEAFRLLIEGAPSIPDGLRKQVSAFVQRLNAHMYWLDVFDMWEDQQGMPRVSWLEGPVAARRRWRQTLVRQ